jgi:hypothetical protein
MPLAEKSTPTEHVHEHVGYGARSQSVEQRWIAVIHGAPAHTTSGVAALGLSGNGRGGSTLESRPHGG